MTDRVFIVIKATVITINAIRINTNFCIKQRKNVLKKIVLILLFFILARKIKAVAS
jgi:hypothetical protein